MYFITQKKTYIHFLHSSSFSDSTSTPVVKDYHENDIGQYLGKASSLPTHRKKELLQNCWTPHKTYDFSKDATHLKRKFNFVWLETYSPWLVYSRHQKGAFCKYCVLFPPPLTTVRGVLGSFMVRPFNKYKNIHEQCRNHMETHFHKDAVQSARLFLQNLPVDVQLVIHADREIEENRKLIQSIISCVAFCGSYDLPLRGKTKEDGVLEGLLQLRIDAGDVQLKAHKDHGRKNAAYQSPQIQNEIINICGNVIQHKILEKAKKAEWYAVLADETADISGKEQLSIGLRYHDTETNNVQEEFVGFVELEALDAKSIAQCIENFLSQNALDPKKCVGLGFDGCSTMSGKEGGVQKILREKYTKALYFHCSSHKLNLVINDLNALAEIRNAIGTIKDIITFFRESVLRRKLIPHISRLCETRWSEKHKTIRQFKEHFVDIIEALEKLSEDGNSATRKHAFQLHSAASNVTFILSMIVIAKYSAIIEPVVNVLQSTSLDTVKAALHIQRILELLKSHRGESQKITEEILEDGKSMMIQMGLNSELNIPRICSRQKNRTNPPVKDVPEYWRVGLVIPYLDSIIMSLALRFPEENTPPFALSKLHPFHMLKLSLTEFTDHCNTFVAFYNLPEIENELELWYNMWKKESNVSEYKEMKVLDVLEKADEFFPAMRLALLILITLPCTTCTVERSFSSLRRIKTWLRSTMGESRLNGLALMSVHRKMILSDTHVFTEEVMHIFSQNPRRLCF